MNQLSTMDIKFDDEIRELFLNGSLPHSWKTLIMSLFNYAPESVLSLYLVKSSILNGEMEIISQDSPLSREFFSF